ncbi:hypothetical protein [Nitrospina watsonii]|uniref:Uncharacterized protein n=1 Tax=Nitrospina watsonii TaxID=1323948 RepID=A0ABN8W7E6_9BACT|nr:hypothetical protein [Nitrospina watsonii]CAI2719561.1 protein of unknown function [Nitrospina watsonii]
MDISSIGSLLPAGRSGSAPLDVGQEKVTLRGQNTANNNRAAQTQAPRPVAPASAAENTGGVLPPDASNLIAGARGQHIDTRA